MEKLRLLLYPLALIYGGILAIRNLAFDMGWLPQYSSKVAVISVGNLSVGGTGKSPMVEFILENLSKQKKVAVLSRGYGRKSEGYLEVTVDSDALAVGDEPLQTKKKFPDITVAVCEERATGLQILEKSHDIILLDDAFQHRYVKPDLQILLTSVTKPYCNDHVLPAGNLREFPSGSNRADIVVLTKVNSIPTEKEKLDWRKKLNVKESTPLLFSSIAYKGLHPINPDQEKADIPISKKTSVYLVTGIADSIPLVNHIKESYRFVKHFKFADHYPFTVQDIEQIAESYKKAVDDSIIVTTQKDAVKLNRPEFKDILDDLPVYELRMTVELSEDDQKLLMKKIEEIC